MRKILVAAVGLVMLMSLSSFASETRTLVMGDNDRILVDDGNIFRFPGRVNNYPNLAIGEFGNGDELYNFGITWQFNDDNPWVLGTFISDLGPVGPTWTDGSGMVSWDGGIPSNRRINLLYGRQLGGNNFGLHIDMVKGSWELASDTSGVTTNESRESFRQYLFGFGLTEATSGQWDVAVNILFGSWTNEDALGNKENEPDGYSDFWLEGRYFMVRNPKVTLVPHAMVGFGKRGLKQYDHAGENWQVIGTGPDPLTLDLTDKHSSTTIDLGIGMNYTPGPNLLAAFDFGMMYTKVKMEGDFSSTMETDTIFSYRDWEDTDKDFVFPYFKIGFEADVFSWMDIRMGATTYWNSSTAEFTGPTRVAPVSPSYSNSTKISSANNDTYLGFGFHWGRLYLDTYTDPELILRGPNFITGDYDGNDMNWQVSATYEMF